MNALTICSMVLLASGATAQTAGSATQYDAYGNVVVGGAASTSAPGDLLNSIPTGDFNNSGLAPFHGNVLRTNYQDGIASVFEINESTGVQVNTYPIQSSGDFGVGYDLMRNLILTCNASSDTMQGFTPGSGVPVFQIPTVGAGPVGIAYDPTRDEYGVCDWGTNQIYIYNAVTLGNVRTLNIGGTLTRLAGVGYDCSNDTYVVGGRDQSAIAVVDPVTGAVSAFFPTPFPGVNNPQGIGISSQSAIWNAAWQDGMVYEVESSHPPTGTSCEAQGTPGNPYCFGDGTGAPCPCSGFGGPGGGCMSTSGTGATLVASGSASTGSSSFTLSVSGAPANKPGLFFQGVTMVAVPAGDGILCSLSTMRYGVNFTDNTGSVTQSNFAANANPGQTLNYQYWFRDTGNPCGGGFNFTNGWVVTWQ